MCLPLSHNIPKISFGMTIALQMYPNINVGHRKNALPQRTYMLPHRPQHPLTSSHHIKMHLHTPQVLVSNTFSQHFSACLGFGQRIQCDHQSCCLSVGLSIWVCSVLCPEAPYHGFPFKTTTPAGQYDFGTGRQLQKGASLSKGRRHSADLCLQTNSSRTPQESVTGDSERACRERVSAPQLVTG